MSVGNPQSMAVPTAKRVLLNPPESFTISTTSTMMDSVEDILYGSIAGVLGKYIEYPFDTVKVRLQSQPEGLPLQYRGPVDCFQQSFRKDGIRGLYRGISAPLVGAALETSSLFVFEQLAQKWLRAAGLYTTEKPLPLSALYLTGAISGAFTSLVLTPIELVKCKMQSPVLVNMDGSIRPAPRISTIISEVYRHKGMLGFWNGQLGTFIRESGGCAAWFGMKETTTVIFRKLNANTTAPDTTVGAFTSLAPLPLWQQAVAGASAGMIYNFLFFPADTIKSRMQTSSVEQNAEVKTFWKEGATLYRQYGIKGLYRGCGITVARSAPSSAFIFIVYDALKQNFKLS